MGETCLFTGSFGFLNRKWKDLSRRWWLNFFYNFCNSERENWYGMSLAGFLGNVLFLLLFLEGRDWFPRAEPLITKEEVFRGRPE